MNMGISHIFPKSILRLKGPSLIDTIFTRTRCVVWMSPAGLERKFDYIRNITPFSQPDSSRNILGAQGLVFRTHWQFNSRRGAVLLMYQPQLISVPDALFNEIRNVPILKNKSVVYQVFNCPGFYMYLSNKGAQLRSLASAMSKLVFSIL